MPSMHSLIPLAVLIACGADEPAAAAGAPVPTAAAAPAEPGEIDVAGLKERLDGGTVRLIDVRTPAEYADARVPGAVNIPLSELAGRMDEISSDRSAEVFLICASGGRSGRATAALADAGFRKPVNVVGGTNAWKAAGLPVDSGSPTAGDGRVE